jgi:MFS family permease
MAYAYAPWRYSQSGHLHVMSSGGIVLALAMLARGHGLSLKDGFRRDRVRPGWALAGWLVAAWQITIGFGIGVVFGYVLGGCVLVGLVAWLLRRWRLPRRLVLFDLLGGVAFLGISAFMVYPYLRVLSIYPNVRRTIEDVAIFSPPWRGFFVAPPESLLWGDPHATVRESLSFPAEMTLLPGFTLIGLALAGLFVSAWSVRTRLLLTAGVVLTVDCALGTRGPFHGWLGYTALFQLPGFNALRTPGRLIAWITLLLGILAAGALTGFIRRDEEVRGNRVPGRRDALVAVATLLPLALVLAEGINKMPHPIGLLAYPRAHDDRAQRRGQ